MLHRQRVARTTGELLALLVQGFCPLVGPLLCCIPSPFDILSGFLVRFVRYGCHRVSTPFKTHPHGPSRPSSLLLRSVVIPPPGCLLSCTVVHCQSSNRFAPQHIWYTAKLVINNGLRQVIERNKTA
ncbi:hypothetical protein DTO271G3_560 [Paecilomyces variotii]|nr:hypothetical protein DTO271G3_560 [Paecilomyces variotii]